ncbi:hypothetical protein K432DRAFT_388667 [Lepidopterella palustris CBS 459.81]|uniref:Uncharacterized protein n=1 Tax=Lepidopterella palustris CBS 459.81 TaxID=1314670 RepID=A0A8E2EKG2_9PEZI|nr:hypothetical protein K432DRAFT_388667 [Lepidopterella palustris CBS 459.81]
MQEPLARDFAQPDLLSTSSTPNTDQCHSHADEKSQRSYSAISSPEQGSPRIGNGPSWAKILFHGISIIASFGAAVAFLYWLVCGHVIRDATGNLWSGNDYAMDERPGLLLIPATLSSIIALCSIDSVVFLSSCFHARYMVGRSESQRLTLLSGHEAGLLVELLTGRFSAWCCSFRFCFFERGPVHPQIKAAVALGSILLLSCLQIVASDIWLHTSISVVKLQAPVTGTHLANFWGRALVQDCDQSLYAQNLSSLHPDLDFHQCASRLGILSEKDEAYQTATNSSAMDRVVLSKGSALLIDTRAPPNASFVASTFGVTTACTPIEHFCEIDANSSSFTCPKHSFAGNFTKTIVLALADDPSVPFSAIPFLVAANLTRREGMMKRFSNDLSGAVRRQKSPLLTVFECVTQVNAWKYIHYDGTTQGQTFTPIAPANAALVLSPMFPGMIQGYNGFGLDILTDYLAAASGTATSLEQLADSLASIFSQTTMASASGITRPIPNDSDLSTQTLTTIPKLAVWLLVSANISYAFLALLLTIGALWCCAKPSVRDFQAQLTVMGIAAKAFEPDHHRSTSARERQDPYA